MDGPSRRVAWGLDKKRCGSLLDLGPRFPTRHQELVAGSVFEVSPDQTRSRKLVRQCRVDGSQELARPRFSPQKRRGSGPSAESNSESGGPMVGVGRGRRHRAIGCRAEVFPKQCRRSCDGCRLLEPPTLPLGEKTSRDDHPPGAGCGSDLFCGRPRLPSSCPVRGRRAHPIRGLSVSRIDLDLCQPDVRCGGPNRHQNAALGTPAGATGPGFAAHGLYPGQEVGDVAMDGARAHRGSRGSVLNTTAVGEV